MTSVGRLKVSGNTDQILLRMGELGVPGEVVEHDPLNRVLRIAAEWPDGARHAMRMRLDGDWVDDSQLVDAAAGFKEWRDARNTQTQEAQAQQTTPAAGVLK